MVIDLTFYCVCILSMFGLAESGIFTFEFSLRLSQIYGTRKEGNGYLKGKDESLNLQGTLIIDQGQWPQAVKYYKAYKGIRDAEPE